MIWFCRSTIALNLLTADLARCLKSGPHEDEQTDGSGSDSPQKRLGLGLSCMKNTRTEVLISGNKLICTLYSGVFLKIIFLEIFRSSLLKNYIEFIRWAFLSSFYRVTQEGQGVIDRKIMSSVTLLKKVSQNILKPHEVWKYETLLHTLAVGSDRLQCILEMIRDQSFVLHFVWWRNTMLWSNTGGCFAFWTGSCTVCIKMTLELFVQTVKRKKKKKKVKSPVALEWVPKKSYRNTKHLSGNKTKAWCFPVLVYSFQTP